MPLIAFKQRRTELPVPRPRDLQRQPPDPRCQLSAPGAMAIPPARFGSLIPFDLEIFGHLGLEYLV